MLLLSPQGTFVALTITASDRIVPPVTTALVADDEVQCYGRTTAHWFRLEKHRTCSSAGHVQSLRTYILTYAAKRLQRHLDLPRTSGRRKRLASHRMAGFTTIVAVSSCPESSGTRHLPCPSRQPTPLPRRLPPPDNTRRRRHLSATTQTIRSISGGRVRRGSYSLRINMVGYCRRWVVSLSGPNVVVEAEERYW